MNILYYPDITQRRYHLKPHSNDLEIVYSLMRVLLYVR